jgi:phasin family protein
MAKQANLDQVVVPVAELNRLAFVNAEKLMNLQFGALKRYADLGLAQVKAGLELKSPEDARDYVAKNAEMAQTVVEAVRADGEAAMEIGNSYLGEVQKLVQANLERVMSKAA